MTAGFQVTPLHCQSESALPVARFRWKSKTQNGTAWSGLSEQCHARATFSGFLKRWGVFTTGSHAWLAYGILGIRIHYLKGFEGILQLSGNVL